MDTIVGHTSIKLSPQESLVRKAGEVVGMVGTQAMKGVHESQENMMKLLGKLEDLVNQRRKKINYDYSDYRKRLCQSDEIFERTLQEIIFNIPEIKNLYDEIISLFPEDMKKFAEDRIREDYLTDLVFESMEIKKGEQEKEYKMRSKMSKDKDKNLKKCKESMKKIQGSGITHLDGTWRGLGEYLGKDGIIEFVLTLKGIGIQYISLAGNELGKYLGVDGMVEFARVLKGSGIRSLNLFNNTLWEHLGKSGMVEFAKALKGSGIGSLNLVLNEIGKFLEKDEIIEFVTALRGSEIQHLNLWDNNIPEEAQQELTETFPDIHFEF
ncbi:hypothetical protein CSB09_02540 [Candidatus Gracilibacteria bacterium]|nr:MAG: hypothetical protein CSB09_02540 [Candidatus Gracilibacteria bacterium]